MGPRWAPRPCGHAAHATPSRGRPWGGEAGPRRATEIPRCFPPCSRSLSGPSTGPGGITKTTRDEDL
eukprot:372654-Pyramimonas_sp.AAC.1